MDRRPQGSYGRGGGRDGSGMALADVPVLPPLTLTLQAVAGCDWPHKLHVWR